VDKVEKFVNQEETLLALRGSLKGHVLESKSSRKNKKVQQEEKQTETKVEARPQRHYQFNIDEWTPLNASINEVLMEVKRDHEF